jgi:hypothetical protein
MYIYAKPDSIQIAVTLYHRLNIFSTQQGGRHAEKTSNCQHFPNMQQSQ